MKLLLGVVGAGIVATALFSNPADARPKCVWQGQAWRCWNSANHDQAWRDRDYRHHDWRRAEHLHDRLDRDRYFGSSVETGRNHHESRRGE
jgi:hypothetical protein